MPVVYTMCDSLHSVVAVSCGDVNTESCSGGVDAVQVQG